MSVITHWDALERALSEAERALRTPPRDAAQGHARVQWAQTEVARVRQQHAGAVEAIRAHRDRWYEVNSKSPDEARPSDRELWAAVLGSDAPGGQSF